MPLIGRRFRTPDEQIVRPSVRQDSRRAYRPITVPFSAVCRRESFIARNTDTSCRRHVTSYHAGRRGDRSSASQPAGRPAGRPSTRLSGPTPSNVGNHFRPNCVKDRSGGHLRKLPIRSTHKVAAQANIGQLVPRLARKQHRIDVLSPSRCQLLKQG